MLELAKMKFDAWRTIIKLFSEHGIRLPDLEQVINENK